MDRVAVKANHASYYVSNACAFHLRVYYTQVLSDRSGSWSFCVRLVLGAHDFFGKFESSNQRESLALLSRWIHKSP